MLFFRRCFPLILAGFLLLPGREARAAGQLKGARLNPFNSQIAKTAQISSTPFDIGVLRHIFDGSVETLARTPNINPAFVQIAYQQARTLRRFRMHCSFGDSYDWSVEAADTEADMGAHAGSYTMIVPQRNFKAGTWDEVELARPVAAKIFRLNVKRIGSDGYCHINEWQLFADIAIDRLQVTPPTPFMVTGEKVQFKALGTSEALNESYVVESGLQWQVSPNIGTISAVGVLTATAPGGAQVRASLQDATGPPALVTVEQLNVQPDVDVVYVERTPRLEFDPTNLEYTSGLPAPNQAMTYLAHVKNWGAAAVTVPYQWWLDGKQAGDGSIMVKAGEEVTVPFKWNWQSEDHDLEFHADPGKTLGESFISNNQVSLRTNALLIGLWVERSLYNYMHQNQYRMKDGGNSFEDWGKRMLLGWNDLFARAVYPLSPRGILDRVALDKVVVVPDGALPLHGGLATNNPDTTDRTIDMQWGYPWNASEARQGKFYGIGIGRDRPFYVDLASVHEMNHARFHIDLYALDVNQPKPPKPARVLLTDDGGNLVAGTPYMPILAHDVVYYNKWRDIMADHVGMPFYDAYSAGVWNWKHHKRGRGNMNSPPDIGIFLRDLPEHNHFHFIDQTGVPLAGAEVFVYQSRAGVFDDTPDITAATDEKGMVSLPRNPFGGNRVRVADNANLILKVRYRRQLYFMFQEVTDFNLEYWRGHTTDASYTREIDLRDHPARVPRNAWLGNYFSGDNFDTYVTSRSDDSIDFDWGQASPIPGLDSESYSVYWQGDIQFNEGWRKFSITADGGFQLSIDGRLVFDQWDNRALKTWTTDLYLMEDAPFVNPGAATANRSFHRVEVRYRHQKGAAQVRLR